MTDLLFSRATAFLRAVEAVENFLKKEGLSEIKKRPSDSGMIGLMYQFPHLDTESITLELSPVFEPIALSDLSVRLYFRLSTDSYSAREYSEISDALRAIHDQLKSEPAPSIYSP